MSDQADATDGSEVPSGPQAPPPQIPAYARPAARLIPTAALAPEQAEQAPQRPRRSRRIILAVLATGALAAVAVFGPTTWRIQQQRDATLATPDTVAQLTRDDSEQAKETSDYLVSVLAAAISLDRTASAIYLDSAQGQERSVMLFGGTALLLDPERELDAVLHILDDDGGVTGLREVDAGDLGGVMKCGSLNSKDAPMVVCGWADHGSIALGLFPHRGADEAAGLLRTLRVATLSR